MIVTTLTNQAECATIMEHADITGMVQPIPPAKSCCGMGKFGQDLFLVIENTLGQFTIHVLEETTTDQAVAFFTKLNEGFKLSSVRPILINDSVTAAAAVNN